MSSVGPSLLLGLVGGCATGAILVPIVFAIWVYRQPPGRCPHCGTAVPRLSRPRNVEQALWGSRTCASCGHTVPGRYGPRR